MDVEKVEKSEAEWRKQLTPEQFEIARQAGTERPGTGKYANNHADGMYKLWVAPMGLRHRAHDLDLHEGGKMPLANNGWREELDDVRTRQAFLNANQEYLAALRARWLSV